jgi:hypothetical protein
MIRSIYAPSRPVKSQGCARAHRNRLLGHGSSGWRPRTPQVGEPSASPTAGLATRSAVNRYEGEGDRTREWWLAAHQEFFRRYLPTIGVDFDPDVATVFERFDVLFPQ